MNIVGSWPGVKQLRAAFGSPKEGVDAGKRRITVTVDLAPPGTNERYIQLTALAREFDELRTEARKARE